MSKKELLLKLLAELTEDDIQEIIADETPVKKGRGRPKKKVAEPAVRPNLFDDMDVKDMFKADTAWQKKIDPIYKNKKKPTQRRPKVQFVLSKCLRCGTEKSVHPKFLIRDDESKDVGYICNKCVRGRG
jgi:hypothetical protein